jgi:hypothetical protein
MNQRKEGAIGDYEPALRNGPLVGQPRGLSKEMFDELTDEFI